MGETMSRSAVFVLRGRGGFCLGRIRRRGLREIAGAVRGRTHQRHHRNRLFRRALLQLEAEAVLLHLEDGKIIFPHEIDDGLDVF